MSNPLARPPAPEPSRFDTAALRAPVLRAWHDSPTRLTEDTNTERDLRVGGYRDRLFVELAQNAADAATAAGQPGRMRVCVVEQELRVANTGAPLDAAGVAALASLRASTKPTGETVGRFGVGFAAVLAVTSEPKVVSTTGGVAFSERRTRDAVDTAGDVPVLRLPWDLAPDEPAVPHGFDTEVRLPLLVDLDIELLLRGIREGIPDLLLALPALERVEVEGAEWARTPVDADTVHLLAPEWSQRWLTQQAGAGGLWAVPLGDKGRPTPAEGDVLHAPTPSDERLSLPARIIAPVPMEPSRRRVLAEAGTREVRDVLEPAARAYPTLVAKLAAEDRLALVPEAGFPLSEVDGLLRELVTDALTQAPWLPAAASSSDLPAGRSRVLALDAPRLVDLVGAVVTDLVAAPLCGPRVSALLATVGARGIGMAELIDQITGISREPSWWYACYAAIQEAVDARAVPADELGGLPVALADGRTVPGPRGALILDIAEHGAQTGGMGDVLDRLADADVTGLRVVHPDAVHPLLVRLGANRGGPADLLAAPELREAVQRSVPDAGAGADVSALAEAVLRLVAEVGTGEQGGLGALALPAAGGGWRRADELVLAGSALTDVLDPDALGEDGPLAVLEDGFAARWPDDVIGAVGVLDSFLVVTDDEPVQPDHELPDEEQWWASLPEPPQQLVAIRDLELVADDAWPAALTLLAQRPDTWHALRVLGGHAGWWISRYGQLGSHPPRYWRLAEATALAGLYDPVPELDGWPQLLRAIGVHARLRADDADDVADLLGRLANPQRAIAPGLTARVHATLAASTVDPADTDPPDRVRTAEGTVVDAEYAAVLDQPWLAAACPSDRLIALPSAPDEPGEHDVQHSAAGNLAALLDVSLASEVITAHVVDEGEYAGWSDLPAVRAVAELLDIELPRGGVLVHDELTIRRHGPEPADPAEHAVAWWCDDRLHATDSPGGLARALAWAAQRWPRRFAIAALLAEPDPTTWLS